ncbi:N-acetylmuramoyl-L-alanine amidase [Peptococcus niger]|uniref:N-acetylmuramoyl-L-alanine amidase n=1 Tax=Peptococcus niger TaxID=2741 RepID=A0A1G6TQJ4_PEPNI|nr:N-acetylmuramoyl-L-alanine amidase [Peptococcus niger]
MMAWHVAQPGYVNQTTIGIECNPRASEGDYATVAELVADLWHEWGKLLVKRHKDYMPTQCPGVYDIDRIVALAEQCYSGEETGKDEVQLRPEVAAWITDLYDKCISQNPSNGLPSTGKKQQTKASLMANAPTAR